MGKLHMINLTTTQNLIGPLSGVFYAHRIVDLVSIAYHNSLFSKIGLNAHVKVEIFTCLSDGLPIGDIDKKGGGGRK